MKGKAIYIAICLLSLAGMIRISADIFRDKETILEALLYVVLVMMFTITGIVSLKEKAPSDCNHGKGHKKISNYILSDKE